MKKSILKFILFTWVALSVCQAADLESALKPFAGYEFGQSKKVLHDTRMTAYRGTDDRSLRLKNEQLLLEFIQSDASLIARREACTWLNSLGSEASRPLLTQLAGQPDFADVAQIALNRIGNQQAQPDPVVSASGVFKAKVLSSANKAELLQQALMGEDPVEAREAFLLIEQGVESKACCAWIARHLDALTEDRQVMALNLMLQLNGAETDAVIRQLSQTGKGAARLVAIGHSTDLKQLDALLFGADPALAGAAKQTLTVLPESIAGPYLVAQLQSSNPSIQAVAIEVAAARSDAFPTAALQVIATQAGHAHQQAGIRALGKAGSVQAYQSMLDAFVTAEGPAVQKTWQAALWDMSRRQLDYGVAVKQIEKAAQSASDASANWLRSMAGKLAGMQATQTLKYVRDPIGSVVKVAPKPVPANIILPGSYRDIIPQRFEVAAYLNCGAQKQVKTKAVSIACPGGKAWNNELGTDPSLSILFAAAPLEFNLNGLESGQDYVLGMTWWDIDFNGRRQSIWINGKEVLPDTPAIAYDEHRAKKGPLGKPTPARIQFALLPEHIVNGNCQVVVKRTGPSNTVTSELWVAKRTQPKAEKQVLLVSGQDFPKHHWRKTGPVMAEILAEDERMEVTICETPYALGLKHLDAYDLIFVHFKNYENYTPSTQVMQDNLKQFVMNGGGMCLSHFACGAFMEWPEFVNLSGRIWSRGGHDPRRPFTVKVVDQKHPITRGLGAEFQTDDELYWCLTGEPDIHLLCNAMSTVKKANQPQALVFEPGKGRTFLCTLGHDVKAFDANEVKQLYRQGAAWAAGL